MSKKLFLVLVMLLCMSAPCGANGFTDSMIGDIEESVKQLTTKVDELVELEKKQIELLKKMHKELEYIAEN